jgi:hypothetical protein
MGRSKFLIGSRLRSREFAAQETEDAIAVAVLYGILDIVPPSSVRGQKMAA